MFFPEHAEEVGDFSSVKRALDEPSGYLDWSPRGVTMVKLVHLFEPQAPTKRVSVPRVNERSKQTGNASGCV